MNDPLYINEGAVPPEEVRIKVLSAEPYPDGQRVKVSIALTPFSKRPNLNMNIMDNAGDEISSVSVIEAMTYQMGLTMHLRTYPIGQLTFNVDVSYPDIGIVDQGTIIFNVNQ